MRIKSFFPMSAAVVTLLSLVSIGCKKSNNSNSNSNPAFSATINDTAFTPSANGVAGFYTSSIQYFNITAIQLKGKDSVSIAVSIYYPFTLNQPLPDTNDGSIMYYDLNGEPYFNQNGVGNVSITVTAYDSVNHKIAGKFSGNLYDNNGTGDSVIVKNGTFNTTYSVQ